MKKIQIIQSNIKNNINEVRSLQPNKEIMVVVKGNAYGHGVIEVVQGLISSGVNYFCVANINEAIEIRKTFPKVRLYVLYGIFDQDINLFKEYDVEINIANKMDWENNKEYIIKNKLKFHIEIDSGMNRTGFKDFEYLEEIKKELEINNTIPLGICTHIAQYEAGYDVALSQVELFKSIVEKWSDMNIKNIHYMNSASIQMFKTDFDTNVRIGNFLYGYYDFDKQYAKNNLNPLNIYENLNVKPILRLKTYIYEIKFVKKGDYIGYGSFKVDHDMNICTIDFGKLDGLVNFVKYDATVKKRNRIVLSGPAMNHMFIEVFDNEFVGDEIYLFEDLNRQADQINRRPIDFIAYLDSSIEREII